MSVNIQTGSGLIQVANKNIPVNKRIEFKNKIDFPAVGEENKLYVAVNENAIYRFDITTQSYICLGNNSSIEIDDTATDVTDKVWSAKKTNDTFEEVKQSVNDVDAKFADYDTSDDIDDKITNALADVSNEIATSLTDYAKKTDITGKVDKLTDIDIKENQILLDDGNGNIKASGKDISEYIPAWSGTKAQWEALDKTTLADGAVVNITDDYNENPVQVKAMPDTATEGDVVQFIGLSDTDYTHGYFYEYTVNESGLLSWKHIPVDAVYKPLNEEVLDKFSENDEGKVLYDNKPLAAEANALIDDNATDVTDKTWSASKINNMLSMFPFEWELIGTSAPETGENTTNTFKQTMSGGDPFCVYHSSGVFCFGNGVPANKGTLYGMATGTAASAKYTTAGLLTVEVGSGTAYIYQMKTIS